MKKYWKKIALAIIGIGMLYLVWRGLMFVTEFINYVVWGI